MATENTLSQQLLDLLATRNLHPEMLDRSGRPTDAPEAKTFTFDYEGASGKNYGTMVIVLDSDNEMKIMYGDNLGRTMEGSDKNEFFDFIQHLSKKATMNRWTHTIADISQLKHTMQGLAAIQEGLFEGYYGNRNISYAGAPTQARLKIKHSQPLGENDARFRHVESLFVETADGECFRLGFRNLSGGRAMLEHVRQGGKPYDIRGCHLTEMVNEIATLARFNRASAGRVLEGVTQEVVSQAQVYYKQLRENLKRMSTSRGYSKYFESWHPADITQQEELVENIKTLFVEQTIDTRIEQALPLLAKIQQGLDMKEAKIFESWIDNLAEGTWNLPETPEQLDKLKTMMAAELIVGPDAINATEQLYDLVGDDILFDRLSELAARDPRANAWNDTEVMNRLAELGIEMPEPSVPGNPAEPATAPVPPVAAAPAAPVAPAVPAAPVAEGKWDPFTGGDYGQTPRPQQVGQDSQDSDIAAPDKEKDQAEWEAMLDYYGTNALVQRALGDLYKQTHGSGYHDSVVTPERYLAIIEKTLGGRTTTEKKYFPNKQAAHKYAKSSFGHVVSFEKIDNKEDTADLITLPVMLGLGQQKKKWMLQFPDKAYAQKWAFKHKNVATILWPEGHNLEKDVTEGMDRGVDAKGRTQAQWIQLVKAKFPDGKMIQAKMPDGPVQVTLPDGRKLGWKKVEQAVAEGQDATTYTVAYKDSQKPGKSYSTQVKATSAAEAKAAFQEWDDTGRFTYLGSRPDVDTVYEDQGVVEGVTSPEIKQAYDAVMQTTPRSPERRAAIAKYQKLRADALKNKQQGVAEGSGPKEKQKTPYRDINSAEYRAAADKQKQRMAKYKAAEPGKKMLAKQGVAEGSDDKFSAADKVEELVRNYKLFDERGWTDLFSKLAGKKLYGPEYKTEIYRAMEYASKFLQLLDSIRMRSDYRGQQDPKKDQELIDLSNQWLDLYNKATVEFKEMNGQGVAESAELNTMLKYAGVPVKESVLTDSTGSTLEHIKNTFRRDVKDFTQTGNMSDPLYDALYDYYFDDMPYGTKKARDGDPYEWISNRFSDDIGLDEGFKDKLAGLALAGTVALGSMGGGAGANIDPYAPDLNTGVKGSSAVISNPGDKKTNIKYQAPIKGQSATIGEADPISTFEVMSGFDAPVAEGSCNMTAEGAYCPEHGLAECGGGMYESREGDAMLARIKSLALLK